MVILKVSIRPQPAHIASSLSISCVISALDCTFLQFFARLAFATIVFSIISALSAQKYRGYGTLVPRQQPPLCALAFPPFLRSRPVRAGQPQPRTALSAYLLSFHIVPNSFAPLKKSTPSFSTPSTLFLQNTRDIGSSAPRIRPQSRPSARAGGVARGISQDRPSEHSEVLHGTYCRSGPGEDFVHDALCVWQGPQDGGAGSHADEDFGARAAGILGEQPAGMAVGAESQGVAAVEVDPTVADSGASGLPVLSRR